MPPRVRRTGSAHAATSTSCRSGALRVRVYAGHDPLTKKRHTLVETIPAGPRRSEAGRGVALDRMQREVADRPAPAHERDGRRAAGALPRPVLRRREHAGALPHARPQPHFAADRAPQGRPADAGDAGLVLRRAAPLPHALWRQAPAVDHRIKPATTMRRALPAAPLPTARAVRRSATIHFILSGAYKRAVRWRWVSVSPTTRPTRRRRRGRTRNRRRPRSPRGSSTRPGVIPTGVRSCGSR